MSKRAVILTGGRGTRLRPYTVVLPKPLMPIGDYPILEVIIRQLVHYGFDHITLAVNHQAELIKAYFGNGEKWGVVIDYSMEISPLGTMGPLRLISDLPENFLVMNGDVLTDIPFDDFFDTHVRGSELFTIASHTRMQLIDYGVLLVDGRSTLTGFVEKPQEKFQVSMGVYMLNYKVLDFIPRSQFFGFDSLMLSMLNKKVDVKVIEHTGNWLDIGRPDDYLSAIDQFEEKKHLYMHV
jgi:NDP-sugar pyrophosphorylase family protein